MGSKPERMNLALPGALLDARDYTFREFCRTAVVAAPALERLP
jgi:hypothetical protein